MSENKRRYLAPKARRGDGHGYVDMPAMGMHEEPECLTEGGMGAACRGTR
jgi:hypothetical protein